MRRTLYISALLTLLICSCDKEEISDIQADSFIKFYTNYPEFTAADVEQISGGYAILGTASTYSAGTQLCLIRTDECGNAIDSACYYGRSLEDQAYCLKVLDDGGFAILGSSKNPSTGYIEVSFIRTNSTGDVQWNRYISEAGDVEAKHFETNDNGDFFMTGYCSSSGKNNQIWLFAIDAEGNDLWGSPKYHGLNYDDEGLHLQILSNGYLAITGRMESYSSGTLLSHAYVLITLENGIPYDWFEIPLSSGNEEGACIRVLDNNKYLVLGTSEIASTTGTTSASSSIILRLVDLTAREVTWAQTYGSSGNNTGTRLINSSNAVHILGTTSITGNNTAITLLATDANGNEQTRFDFGLGSQLSASAFEQTPDGGFIIVGTNKHSENNIAVALIKTGSDGQF
jgi:hypothetical protein